MRGSRIPNPVVLGAAAVAATMIAVASLQAADYDPSAPVLGKPVVLFSPSATATPPATRSPAVVAPAKRPVVPVQRIPLDGKPLIPPAPLPAKVGAPPDPQPALSLETDLQPVGPAAPTAGAAAPPTDPATQPPAAKSPPG